MKNFMRKTAQYRGLAYSQDPIRKMVKSDGSLERISKVWENLNRKQ